MTLAKAFVTGIIFRSPEKRFTTNNVPVCSFVLNIGEREEMLIRVLSKRAALTEAVEDLQKGEKVAVEGRLQIANVKSEDGTERRIYEIDANAIERLGASVPSNVSSNDSLVNFGEDDFADDLIGEDEIPF